MSFFEGNRVSEKIFANRLFKIHVNGLRAGGYIVGGHQHFELWHMWRSAFLSLSISCCCVLQFWNVILGFGKFEKDAVCSANAFLYLSSSIFSYNAFFRRGRLARMLNFLQEDVDSLLRQSDERERTLFRETHRYVDIITGCIWGSTVVAGMIAYIDAFYRFAFNPDSIFNLEQVHNGTEVSVLLLKLNPFREVHNGLFVGYLLPMYSMFLGITAIPMWHTFVTSLMSYTIVKWKILHKRISQMDFGSAIMPIVKKRNLKINAISLATMFNYLSITIAMENGYFFRKRLTRIVAFLQDDVDKLLLKSDKREETMFADTHRKMHRITVCILLPSVVATSIAYFDAFFRFAFRPDSIFTFNQAQNGSDTQALLIQLFPFREVHDDLFVGYILPMYALFLAVAATPLWHTFIASLMQYVILKWQIVHKRLSEMDTSKVILEPNESVYYFSLSNENDRINYLRTRLCIFCIKEQLRIRWFIKELQELIWMPVFADFMIFSILICFLFYEMASGNLSNMDFLFMCLYLFVMASILWLYHWHATLIKENSDQMSFAIYSCDWYTYPIHVQKIVHLIMMNTSHPLEMRAVFVTLNLTTFIDIMRASYSYFSILRNSF